MTTVSTQATLRLFGAFRNLQADPELRLEIPESVATIGDLREHLSQHFKQTPATTFDALGLLKKSAIANDKQVLDDHAQFNRADRLALLPPVSGG